MQNVCIVGVGLIGGSLGKALRRVRRRGKRQYHVSGLGRSRSGLKQAKASGAVDEISSRISSVSQADVVVLSVPVDQIVPQAKKILPFLKKEAVITDVGSVKDSITKELREILSQRRDVQFVGGHPLAGSEKSGVQNATFQLFENAPIILTPNGSSFRAVNMVKTMWNDVGGHCLSLSASDHDQILALTSHLPHLLAFALFQLTQEKARKDSRIRSLVAGSFRDMTRIAASDPSIWTGILKQNRQSILAATRAFLVVLNRLATTPQSKLRQTLSTISRTKKSW